MPNNLSQAIKTVFSPETIVPFVVGSVSLAVFGSALYDICKNIFGTTTPDLIKIGAIALVILLSMVFAVWWFIAQRLSRLTVDVPFEVAQKKLDRKYPGLILLVSNLEACEQAIQFHLPQLKRCWLISSQQKLEIAQTLCQRFPTICVDRPILINDVYDPLEFRDRIDEIYRTRLPKGWREAGVIADYTGMTAHASVGTVLACFGKNRPLQYTPVKTDSQGKIVGSFYPIRILLHQEVPKPQVTR
jgi:hypothetical protein